MATAGIELVFGGGRVGLMGVVADAVLGAGGRAVGIIPEHLVRAEVGHAAVTELQITKTMHERKAAMFARSDAFVVLPGGPGTLDETFEILTWRQLALHDKPVVICDLGGFWQPLIRLIDQTIAERYARPEFRDFFTIVERIEDVIPTLRLAPSPRQPSRIDRV
jgi:uncharacterized protein (TIGR00730 family)